MAEVEKPLARLKREEGAKKDSLEKKREEYEKEKARWAKELKGYKSVSDYFLWEARKKGAVTGEAIISPALLDQIVTLNPVCLEGQAEMIYNAFIYRTAKWKYIVEKANEIIKVTPQAPPAFAGMMSRYEAVEQRVKSDLASAAQAVADYELLKHDERKYKEILDYFEMGKKDEHILRSLYIDRIDAYTGEGYSMVSMAKRWPTIISDFLKMKSEWEDTKTIRKELQVSDAEANVLKTKNELFKEWKKIFFPDVRERYVRIKNLVESRRRSVDEYREWIKPYLSKLKRVQQLEKINTAEGIMDDMTDATKLVNTPQGEIEADFWFWKPIRPEETHRPLVVTGWGEIPVYDDWVKEKIIMLEAKYDVVFSEKEIQGMIKNFTTGGRGRYGKRPDIVAQYPRVALDERFLYYYFIDLEYVCQYKKGSTGPMVVEDQYWHFHPFLISKNFVLLMLLELEYKKRKIGREIEKLIGVKEEEERIRKDVMGKWAAEGEEPEKGEKPAWLDTWEKLKKNRRRKLKNTMMPVLRLFFKPGPYESNVLERISKIYALNFGSQVAELRDLIKEFAYKISGQRP